jgi:phosphoenolpyruvate carboxykinase (GTP)
MGPIDSSLARSGVEITDSAYVAANMKLMTRMGKAALARIAKDGVFVRGLHSIGELDPKRRFIMHFPESLEIQSFGSGYGGNALLGKKCHALRIASWQARQEGWLAEHMLIVGIENPAGETHYLACAFPSACGKTNLAMLIPPATMPGWKVWTVGDDIAWLHPGEDGRLWAINPEAGYFGVVPGTNAKTNRHAYEMIRHDTIFTNVGMTADGQPWWEGLEEGEPVADWQGRPYDPTQGPAAHPNSRFTVAAKQNPSYSPKTDAPEGVPITALVFGGRRRMLAPLVYQARDWAHGVLVGAGMASETTAAATGDVGVVRRDPMAMKPFAGYNFADYWGHWLSMAGRLKKPPGVFHVNWFRRDAAGRFLWPGFGDNLRVLAWIIARANGGSQAVETPIGAVPRPDALDLSGLDIAEATIAELLSVDTAAWRTEASEITRYFDGYGSRLPARLKQEVEELNTRLARA